MEIITYLSGAAILREGCQKEYFAGAESLACPAPPNSRWSRPMGRISPPLPAMKLKYKLGLAETIISSKRRLAREALGA